VAGFSPILFPLLSFTSGAHQAELSWMCGVVLQARIWSQKIIKIPTQEEAKPSKKMIIKISTQEEATPSQNLTSGPSSTMARQGLNHLKRLRHLIPRRRAPKLHILLHYLYL